MGVLDECCEVPRCCWYFKLRRGCYLIAFSSLVPLVVVLLLLGITAAGHHDLGLGPDVAAYAVYFFFLLCVKLFIASVVLLFGICLRREGMISIYTWHLLVHGLIIAPYFIFTFLMAVLRGSLFLACLILIFSVVDLTFVYHYFLVTNSYRMTL